MDTNDGIGTGSERRRAPRHAVHLPADILIRRNEAEVDMQGVILDLSESGALVALSRGEEKRLPETALPEVFELEFRPPGSGTAVRAVCSTTRADGKAGEPMRLGGEFDQVGLEDRAVLARYLNESARDGTMRRSPRVRALIMDDDEIYLMLVRSYLEQLGFEVVDAMDGCQGVKMFSEKPADLVVVDILMPEKDGLEAIREIRKASRDVDIIAISAGLRGVYNPLNAAKAMGATRVLKKPFDREMLMEVLLSLPKRIRELTSDGPEGAGSPGMMATP